VTALAERSAAPPVDRRSGAYRSPLIGSWVVRSRRVSIRVDGRSVAVGAVLALATVVVSCWSISVGDFPVPVSEVIRSIVGTGSDDAEFIVGSLRLPRVLTGAMVGAALAVSGAIFQSLARNPLASPDVIGFDSGAALGAVFTIVMVGGGSLAVSLGALAGGFVTALAVYVFAYKRGVQGYRLILVGLGVGFAAKAGSDYLLTRAQIYDVQRAVVWLAGSLNARSWEHVTRIGVGLVVLMPLAVALLSRLRLLELGTDVAAGLGVHVGRVQVVLVVVGVALAALATASAGPIGFVALIAPPITRRLVRSPGATIVPTALFGALLTVAADLAARRVLAPVELPVGIATAIVGAPYLLWLLTREIRTGAM
jgi:iron complex transport system permease protein